jgi:hypothetical protein
MTISKLQVELNQDDKQFKHTYEFCCSVVCKRFFQKVGLTCCKTLHKRENLVKNLAIGHQYLLWKDTFIALKISQGGAGFAGN